MGLHGAPPAGRGHGMQACPPLTQPRTLGQERELVEEAAEQVLSAAGGEVGAVGGRRENPKKKVRHSDLRRGSCGAGRC